MQLPGYLQLRRDHLNLMNLWRNILIEREHICGPWVFWRKLFCPICLSIRMALLTQRHTMTHTQARTHRHTRAYTQVHTNTMYFIHTHTAYTHTHTLKMQIHMHTQYVLIYPSTVYSFAWDRPVFIARILPSLFISLSFTKLELPTYWCAWLIDSNPPHQVW